MKLVSFTIPENSRELPGWLERHLVGLELHELVNELETLHARGKPTMLLEDACGAALPEVLRRGMAALSQSQIQALLSNPRLLLDLQEKVLVDGGDYWRSVPVTPEHRRAVDGTWQSIESATTTDEPVLKIVRPARDSAKGRATRWWLTSALVAAAIVASVGVWIRTPSQSQGWGWDRQGALRVELSAPKYLNHLADSAGEWFKKRPETKDALVTRLREFRHGCDTLIEAPHPQLAAADRDWLVERCRVWSGKLDAHLAKLEAGGDLQEVQTEADDTVQKLIDALRSRSEQSA